MHKSETMGNFLQRIGLDLYEVLLILSTSFESSVQGRRSNVKLSYKISSQHNNNYPVAL